MPVFFYRGARVKDFLPGIGQGGAGVCNFLFGIQQFKLLVGQQRPVFVQRYFAAFQLMFALIKRSSLLLILGPAKFQLRTGFFQGSRIFLQQLAALLHLRLAGFILGPAGIQLRFAFIQGRFGLFKLRLQAGKAFL